MNVATRPCYAAQTSFTIGSLFGQTLLSSYSCLLVYMNSMNRMTICVFTGCCKSWNKAAIRCQLKLGPFLDHRWILSLFSGSSVNSMTSINTCWSRKRQKQFIFLFLKLFFCCFIRASSEGVKEEDASTEVGVCSNWENWRFRRHRCAHYFQLPTAMFSSKHPNNCLRSFCLLSETAGNPFFGLFSHVTFLCTSFRPLKAMFFIKILAVCLI